MTKFKHKNILITGGASGIGRLMGMEMASKGGTIVIWDINSELLDQTAAEIRSTGAKVLAHICDITDKEMVYNMAEKIKMEIGSIDIVINNAGVVTGKPFWECSDNEIKNTMEVGVIQLNAKFLVVLTFLQFCPMILRTKKFFLLSSLGQV